MTAFLSKVSGRRRQKVDTSGMATGEKGIQKVENSHERRASGKKTRSLQNDDSKPLSGVFVSNKTLSELASPPPSLSSILSSSTTSDCSSRPGSWKSSGTKAHHKNSPLIVDDPDKQDGVVSVDLAERLGKAMARSRKLPNTWYFSSNHVLVNQERSQRVIAPLTRMLGLDAIARLHAEEMAATGRVYYLDLSTLTFALKDINCRRLGVNVQKGKSIRDIHKLMMQALSNKNNILDRRFTHMGMGTAVGKDGALYLCQIFRG